MIGAEVGAPLLPPPPIPRGALRLDAVVAVQRMTLSSTRLTATLRPSRNHQPGNLPGQRYAEIASSACSTTASIFTSEAPCRSTSLPHGGTSRTGSPTSCPTPQASHADIRSRAHVSGKMGEGGAPWDRPDLTTRASTARGLLPVFSRERTGEDAWRFDTARTEGLGRREDASLVHARLD